MNKTFEMLFRVMRLLTYANNVIFVLGKTSLNYRNYYIYF